MRVKLGEVWYEPDKYFPLMVEFTKDDLDNIKNMPEDARLYAVFDEFSELSTAKERRDWMLDGARHGTIVEIA